MNKKQLKTLRKDILSALTIFKVCNKDPGRPSPNKTEKEKTEIINDIDILVQKITYHLNKYSM